jgi:hypothetical protein
MTHPAELRRLRTELASLVSNTNFDATRARFLEKLGGALADAATELDELCEYVVRWHGDPSGPKDHACKECVPDGRALVAGFQCMYYRAVSILGPKRVERIEGDMGRRAQS